MCAQCDLRVGLACFHLGISYFLLSFSPVVGIKGQLCSFHFSWCCCYPSRVLICQRIYRRKPRQKTDRIMREHPCCLDSPGSLTQFIQYSHAVNSFKTNSHFNQTCPVDQDLWIGVTQSLIFMTSIPDYWERSISRPKHASYQEGFFTSPEQRRLFAAFSGSLFFSKRWAIANTHKIASKRPFKKYVFMLAVS